MGNATHETLPVQVSTYGVRFLTPTDKTGYEQAKYDLSNAREKAEKIIADAEVRSAKLVQEATQERDSVLSKIKAESDALLIQAQSEADALLQKAKKSVLEVGAAELTLYKRDLDTKYAECLSQIKQGLTSTLEEITEYLFSNSSKSEYIFSQVYDIAKTQLLDKVSPGKTTIKGAPAVLKGLMESIKQMDNDLVTHLSFTETDATSEKVTIELADKILVIDPQDFLTQVKKQLIEGPKND